MVIRIGNWGFIVFVLKDLGERYVKYKVEEYYYGVWKSKLFNVIFVVSELLDWNMLNDYG